MKLSKIVCLTLLLLANLSVNAESLIEWRVNGVLQNFSLLQGNPIELIAGNNYRISFSNLNYIGPNNGESYDSPDGQTHLSQSLIGATSGGFWYKVSFADSNNLNMHQIMENYFEDFNSSETSTVGGKGYFPGSSSMDSYSGTHPNNQTIWNDLDGSIFLKSLVGT